MTTLLLIRHAMTDVAGRQLSGMKRGVHLNAAGHEQAAALRKRVNHLGLAAIYVSPLERAMETAAPLAAAHMLEPMACPALGELEFGEWTGRDIADLDDSPQWRRFNNYRSGTRIPGGESMLEVQARVVAQFELIARAHPDDTVAVITHGDVIRAALAHYAGIPIDLCLRLEIAPASISVVKLTADGPQIGSINDTGQVL